MAQDNYTKYHKLKVDKSCVHVLCTRTSKMSDEVVRGKNNNSVCKGDWGTHTKILHEIGSQ